MTNNSKNAETILYIVRHGQSESNIRQSYGGHTDVALTDAGREQARKRAQEFKSIKFDAVYSSDLSRAKETAELIKLERDLVIKTTELLRERNFGDLEDRTHKEVREQYQELFKTYDSLSQKERFHFKLHPTMEGGEELLTRFITTLREISLANMSKLVLVASHGSVLRGFLGHLDERYYSMRTVNTGWVKLSCDGVNFKILETNGIISREEYEKTYDGTTSLTN